MNDRDDELRQAVALFRYGLIADLVHLPPGTAGIRQRLREKAERTYTIPGTRRTRVAAETMRDWLSVYRTGGFPLPYMPTPLPRRKRSGAPVASLPGRRRPSPFLGRVGFRVALFEACSAFALAPACMVAEPPEAAL